MRIEKTFKRENGMQYNIVCDLYVDSIRETHRYSIRLWCREKGKKSWHQPPDTLPDYSFRALSMEERELHIYKNILRFVTEEEILSVKLELWNKIKPTK